MATLGTLVKPKRRHPRKAPLNFKIRKSSRIRKGKP